MINGTARNSFEEQFLGSQRLTFSLFSQTKSHLWLGESDNFKNCPKNVFLPSLAKMKEAISIDHCVSGIAKGSFYVVPRRQLNKRAFWNSLSIFQSTAFQS